MAKLYELHLELLPHPPYFPDLTPSDYWLFDLVWFLCLMAYQLFLGYLMSKPFSEKNSSGTI